jgi:hydroxylamine reductase
MMENKMFCYQCEQTANGTGCKVQGVCGKDPKVSALIDLTMYATKGLSMYAHRARQLGAKDREIDVFVVEALFSTVTNVNFDPERYQKLLQRLIPLREKAKRLYEDAARKAGREPEKLSGPAACAPATNLDGLVKQGEELPITKRMETLGNDVTGLQELIVYGLKGMAAYADHAHILGKEDDGVYAFFHETLDYLALNPTNVDELVAKVFKCGEVNLKVLELLDAANTGTYGHPVPTRVRIEPVKGKAILVSGHDLKDLEELLRQTEGKGINIYTHGEMLPAHAYPELKKYKHLVGNFGGAWQDQQKEFTQFPGAILMTTNCIQRPQASYKGRIFTSGLVAWPGVVHVGDRNFAPLIKCALEAEGFRENGADKTIAIGFGHKTVLGVADKVISAVKSGAIKYFFLIGGCDGAKPGRNYYTEFAESVPKDSIILTLACGKYRFNKMEFGEIGGIPRLLDCGQCNDSFSAVKIALELSKAFNCSVNDLPLSLILSWYEQKAVCILLSLLYLGIKNMRLGPSLPAFVTPNVLKVLVEKFNIMRITTAKEDLKAILG